MYILSFISLFHLVAIYALEVQYLPINHTHNLDLVNMSSSMAVAERQSLGRPDYRLLQGSQGMINSYLLDHISTYTTDCHIHSEGCWGYFVLRTVYGDDERVAAAMGHFTDAIENKIVAWRKFDGPGPMSERLDKEVRDRYHSVLIEHPSLDGAGYEEAREYFRKWAEPYVTCSALDDGDSEISDCSEDPWFDDVGRTARFRGFFLLDELALGNLERLPAKGDVDAFDKLARNPKAPWIKLVGTNDKAHYGNLGVGAYELLDIFGWLCDRDQGVQTLPKNGDFPEDGDPDHMWELFQFF